MKTKKNNTGMTLAELMIAIFISTIVVFGFSALIIKTWNSHSFAREEGQASLNASRGVNAVVKDLRKAKTADNGAYPVKACSDFDLTVFIDTDNDGVTEKVHYFLDSDNQQLKKGIANPSGTPAVYPEEDQEVSVVADSVVNSASQPVFFYYNKNYPGDTINNPLSGTINVGDVRLIKIHLFVNIDPNQAPDNINIEGFAELRNINDYE